MRYRLSTVALFGVAVFLCLWVFLNFGQAAETGPKSSRAERAIELNSESLKRVLQAKGLEWGQPVFMRIVKSSDGSSRTGKLEMFVEDAAGHYVLFKNWDICTYSGTLGPKLKEGDGQSPEGFYFTRPGQMNPNSSYHLSFNLGFPNVYDRAHGRTGSFLMVHGDCVSIGCYAMTDPGIEEIYTMMSAAFDGGQPFIRVHAFPFPMTKANLDAHKDNSNYEFWVNLKEGWDWFETYKRPPNVTVSSKTYQFGSD